MSHFPIQISDRVIRGKGLSGDNRNRICILFLLSSTAYYTLCEIELHRIDLNMGKRRFQSGRNVK